MDQNEDIFVRFMNDVSFQKVVTSWMSEEAYRRLRASDGSRSAPRPKLRRVEGAANERYVTCVPLVPLQAAAGAFGDPQHVVDGEFEWVEVDTERLLRPGMFVAQVVGRSMQPAVDDGAYCLFSSPVAGSRQGRIVLVQLRDASDPETGHRYTVKRYESEKARAGDSWRHTRVTLEPTNPAYAPIVLEDESAMLRSGLDYGAHAAVTEDGEEGAVQVIAEVVEVLGTDPPGKS